MPKPVLFLAFANDRVDAKRFLRSLNRELMVVRDALASERWMVHDVVDATLGDIVRGLQRHADHVALFHYGGHAGDYELLLQRDDGTHATTLARGLARLLGNQRALRCVFLNGCSTRGHVRDLLDAGVPAVIATRCDVEDERALDFARHFYGGLAAGATLGRAFADARAAIEAALGTSSVGAMRRIDTRDEPSSDDDAFPWELHVAEGAESVRDWSLGNAIDDPLFGVPEPPDVDLPPTPFRHLAWFRPEHAALFFGRGKEIRLLYDRITQPDAPPIVLLHGASGAGKSSLLAAGVTPRLRATHRVVYARRDETLGLTGALRRSLSLSPDEPLDADGWRALERRVERPVVVVLDQIEEAFTRLRAPSADMRDEFDALVADLVTLFRDRFARPSARLVLGFRKEWLAEIRARLVDARLPLAEVFVDRLDRASIVDAIAGVTRDARLRDRYCLSIEDGLAELIADDLLVDPESPIAPTLQVLLAKLWDAAPPHDARARRFDRGLYQPLKDQGILLGDFVDQQLAALGTTHASEVASGLALDVLAFHTTPHRTAATRTLAELRATYPGAADTLPALLGRCAELSLLVAPRAVSDETPDATRLAHDTLAPLVRDRVDGSTRPAQQARRILESRTREWLEGWQRHVLDEIDLAIVDAARPSMRRWTDDEARLVDESRHELAERRGRELLQRAAAAPEPAHAVALLGRLAGEPAPPGGVRVASLALRRPVATAVHRLPAALTRFAAARDGRLYAAFGGVLAVWRDDPGDAPDERRWHALIGGFDEGWERTRSHLDRDARRFVRIVATAKLHFVDAPDREPVELVPNDPVFAEGGVNGVVFSADGSRVATQFITYVGDDTSFTYVSVWDAHDGAWLADVRHPAGIDVFALDESGRRLVTSGDGVVVVWSIDGGASRPEGVAWSSDDCTRGATRAGGFSLSTRLASAELGRDGALLVVDRAGPDHDFGRARLFDGEDAYAEGYDVVGLVTTACLVSCADAESDLVVLGHHDGTVRCVPVSLVDDPRAGWSARGHASAVRGIALSRDGALLATEGDDGVVRVWETSTLDPVMVLRNEAIRAEHERRVPVCFTAEGDSLITAQPLALRRWPASGAAEPARLGRVWGTGEHVRGPWVTPDSRHCAFLADARTAHVLSLDAPSARAVISFESEGTWHRVVGACIDASHLTLAFGSGVIKQTRIDGTGTIERRRGPIQRVAHVRIMPGSPHVVAQSYLSPDAKIWDPRRVVAWRLDDPDAAARVLGFTTERVLMSGDGRRIVGSFAAAVDGAPHGLLLWDLARPDRHPRRLRYDGYRPALLSRDGSRLFLVREDGSAGWSVLEVRLDDVAAAAATLPMRGARPCDCTPDVGRVLGVTDDGWRVCLCAADEAGAYHAVLDVDVHRGPVREAALSPDGRWIIAVGEDVMLYASDGSTTPLSLGHDGDGPQYVHACFTPDSRRVLTTDANGSVRSWRIAWDDLAAAAHVAARLTYEVAPFDA